MPENAERNAESAAPPNTETRTISFEAEGNLADVAQSVANEAERLAKTFAFCKDNETNGLKPAPIWARIRDMRRLADAIYKASELVQHNDGTVCRS